MCQIKVSYFLQHSRPGESNFVHAHHHTGVVCRIVSEVARTDLQGLSKMCLTCVHSFKTKETLNWSKVQCFYQLSNFGGGLMCKKTNKECFFPSINLKMQI